MNAGLCTYSDIASARGGRWSRSTRPLQSRGLHRRAGYKLCKVLDLSSDRNMVCDCIQPGGLRGWQLGKVCFQQSNHAVVLQYSSGPVQLCSCARGPYPSAVASRAHNMGWERKNGMHTVTRCKKRIDCFLEPPMELHGDIVSLTSDGVAIWVPILGAILGI